MIFFVYKVTLNPPNPCVKVNCVLDPCKIPKENGCEYYPNAECRSNYCNGCNFAWYVNNQVVDCGFDPSGQLY